MRCGCTCPHRAVAAAARSPEEGVVVFAGVGSGIPSANEAAVRSEAEREEEAHIRGPKNESRCKGDTDRTEPAKMRASCLEPPVRVGRRGRQMDGVHAANSSLQGQEWSIHETWTLDWRRQPRTCVRATSSSSRDAQSLTAGPHRTNVGHSCWPATCIRWSRRSASNPKPWWQRSSSSQHMEAVAGSERSDGRARNTRIRPSPKRKEKKTN